MDEKNHCNIDDDGRRRGLESLKRMKDLTPDRGPGAVRGNQMFAERIGKRRFDEPGMVVEMKQ